MNRGVALIWAGMLLATVVGVVPALLTMLSRALTAARAIERYSAEILAGGVAIAGNTANIPALKQTIAMAPTLLAAGESLERHSARIQAALAAKQPGNGHVGPGEV